MVEVASLASLRRGRHPRDCYGFSAFPWCRMVFELLFNATLSAVLAGSLAIRLSIAWSIGYTDLHKTIVDEVGRAGVEPAQFLEQLPVEEKERSIISNPQSLILLFPLHRSALVRAGLFVLNAPVALAT